MNIDFATMITIKNFLAWVLKHHEDKDNFYSNALNQFNVHYIKASQLSVIKHKITYTISHDLTSDIASITNEFYNKYETFALVEEIR